MKKYCTTRAIKKGKYTYYKRLSPKYATNSNFFLSFKLLFANCLYKIIVQAVNNQFNLMVSHKNVILRSQSTIPLIENII